MDDYLNEVALAQKVATPKPGDCPYTIFLGAGASVTAAIPSAQGMVREWQKLLYRSIVGSGRKGADADFDKWVASEYSEWKNQHSKDNPQSDYSFLFGRFYQQPKERQLYLEQLMEGKKPTFGYLYLAGLIAQGRFSRIVTTNFDDLLNDALVKYYGMKPIVCAFDSAVAGIRVASLRPKIIKLHGDFLYDNIRNMKHELKSLDSNMEEKLYELCKDCGLIVVGYSGGDESVMAPLRDMLRKAEYLNMGLHWCIYRQKDGTVQLPPKLADLKNYHGDRVHIYVIDGFDRLMEEMFIECGSHLPKSLTDPHRNSLPKEFYESVRSGTSQELTSSMRAHLNLIVEKARQKIDRSEYEVIQADLKWELGAEARKQENLVKAKLLFREGYDLINGCLAVDTLPIELLLKTLRRKSGLCLALAKLSKQEGTNDWLCLLAEALEVVDRGITLYKTQAALGVPEPIKRTFPYNGCCAYSLTGEWKSVGKKEKMKVLQLLREIKLMDAEGEHISKLLGDTDFQYLYRVMRMDIEAMLQ
jgi:NAD-dependent SIR2 family protein deacetylase